MVLLLGIFYHPAGASYNATEIPDVVTMQDVMRQFVHMLPGYGREVISSILPVPVSYTHLDVYKRQMYHSGTSCARISVFHSSFKPFPLRTDSMIVKDCSLSSPFWIR